MPPDGARVVGPATVRPQGHGRLAHPAQPVPSRSAQYHDAMGWRPAGRSRPRRTGWLALLLAVLATLLLVPVAVAHSRHPTTRATTAGSGQAVPPAAGQGGAQRPVREFTEADVIDLLDRYSGALRNRNWAALAEQLDTRSKPFVATQRRLFGNLRQLDLATLRYIVTSASLPEVDPVHPGAYTAGWAEAWRQMQIQGIDPYPAAQYFRVQLAVVGGRLIITNVVPATTPASTRQPAPWDVAALTVVRSRHVVVAGTADVVGRLGQVSQAAEQAIADAGPCWPASWQHTFTIFATGDRKAFSTWFRSQFTNTEFIGFEIGLPVVDDSGEIVPGREDDVPQVVIDVPGALKAPLGFRQLLEHEMTHAASGAERNAATETWAIEGYADFVAFHNGTLRQANRGGMAYRTFHSTGGLTVKLPANPDFYGKTAALNYDLAFLAMWYMREKYGQGAVVAWFAQANKQGNAATALQQRFRVTPQAFVADWARWTFRQLQ
jgi:hypothetical protein